jgi:hypothetical protein
MAPKSTALITVPASCARRDMSKSTAFCATFGAASRIFCAS